jgi:hypothetical protein
MGCARASNDQCIKPEQGCSVEHMPRGSGGSPARSCSRMLDTQQSSGFWAETSIVSPHVLVSPENDYIFSLYFDLICIRPLPYSVNVQPTHATRDHCFARAISQDSPNAHGAMQASWLSAIYTFGGADVGNISQLCVVDIVIGHFLTFASEIRTRSG